MSDRRASCAVDWRTRGTPLFDEPTVAVVVGNPKPKGRTWRAAHRVASELGNVSTSVDVVTLGPPLMGWGDEAVRQAVTAVARCDIAVFASPVYKAAYSGVLKLFLDKFDGGTGLAGVVAVALQLGGDATHSLAPEIHLRPVLSELGATIPAPSLYLIDGPDLDPKEQDWLRRWQPVVRHAAHLTK